MVPAFVIHACPVRPQTYVSKGQVLMDHFGHIKGDIGKRGIVVSRIIAVVIISQHTPFGLVYFQVIRIGFVINFLPDISHAIPTTVCPVTMAADNGCYSRKVSNVVFRPGSEEIRNDITPVFPVV